MKMKISCQNLDYTDIMSQEKNMAVLAGLVSRNLIGYLYLWLEDTKRVIYMSTKNLCTEYLRSRRGPSDVRGIKLDVVLKAKQRS